MKALEPYELLDLQEAVLELLPSKILPAITKANRTGELKELLRLLEMEELIDKEGEEALAPTRIIVIGDSMISEQRLRSIAKKKGYDAQDFEFMLGYHELKHGDLNKLRRPQSLRAVLVGPMPHSTPGKGDFSSLIARMENNPSEYPPLIRLQDASGLKITNNSFARALDQLACAA